MSHDSGTCHMIRASASHDMNTSKEIGLTIVSSNRHRETLQYRITTRILATCIRKSKRKRLKQETHLHTYMHIHVKIAAALLLV